MNVAFYKGYEIFPLCGSQQTEMISFNEHVTDLSDGYSAETLYGAQTGLRRWNLSFPNMLDGSAAQSVNLNGLDMTPADYIWDLFCRTKTTGTPFIVSSPKTGNYCLAKFAQRELSYEQAKRKLFSTGLDLVQVRRSGVYVFDPSLVSGIQHWWAADAITGASDNTTLPDDIWEDAIASGEDLQSANCTYQTAEQNSLPIVRLDQSGTTDSLSTATSTTFHEAFLVLKVREATFAEYRGIISNNDSTLGTPALLGQDNTTKFYDLSLGDAYSYRLNGVAYAASNQQAPMSAFGVVHIRNTDGWTMAEGLLFGKDRPGTYPERAADVDFGEIIVTGLLPSYVAREIEEYLTVKWGI